jgi:hypothetical protein
MTQLLERAVKQISSLPDKEQDALAEMILAEVKSEKRWDEQFESSRDTLSDMAAEALAEEKAGKTSDLDLSRDFS